MAKSLFLLLVANELLIAVPTGIQVTEGFAEISPLENGLHIEQLSDRAILHWEDFSIASGERVHFQQPGVDSAILNRVSSSIPSEIHGTLTANGQVFLLNPQGILVGPEGVIQTNGFIASTLNLEDVQFLSGGELHFVGESVGVVQNLGKIDGGAGNVFLIGTDVQNGGELRAGYSGVAGGSDVLIKPSGSERIFVRGSGRIVNEGMIEGLTAELKACGGNPYPLAIRQDGVIRANAIEEKEGRIFLRAFSGKTAIAGEMEAERGQIQIVSEEIHLEPSAEISVNAGQLGNGGSVEVIARDNLIIEGFVTARGGDEGGDGGFIEFSAAHFDFLRAIDMSAPKGKGGHLLLDPFDIAFANADPGGTFSWVDVSGTSTLIPALNMGAVTVTTAMSGGGFFTYNNVGPMGQPGDIVIFDPFTVAGAFDLTLIADHDITVNAAVINSGGGGFSFQATNDITFNFGITTTGTTGSITVNATNDVFINSTLHTTMGNLAGTGFIDVTAGNNIDLGTTGVCIVDNSNSPLTFLAGNNFIINSGNNPASICALTTFGQPISITATAGTITDFGCTVNCIGGNFTMQTMGAGDITMTGAVTSGQVLVQAGAGGSLWLGNSAANVSTQSTAFAEGGMTSSPVTFQGDNITIRGGAGVFQPFNVSNHSDFTAHAVNGNFVLLGGDGMGSLCDIRSAVAGATYLITATGAATIQGGAGDNSHVDFGPTGLAGGTGVLDITTGTTLSILAGAGAGSNADCRGSSGTWMVGADFLLQGGPGPGTTSLVNCYMDNANATQTILTVLGNLQSTGGLQTANSTTLQWANTQFTIMGNLSSTGGMGMQATSGIEFDNLVGNTSTVGTFLLCQGGVGDDADGDIFLRSTSNGLVSITTDATVTGGIGERARAQLGLGDVTLDVGNILLVQGVTGLANIDLSSDPVFLLVHNFANFLGGAGGTDPQSTGAAQASGDADFQFEVGDPIIPGSGTLTMTAGTGVDASAFIIQALLDGPIIQRVYTLLDVSINASVATTASSGIFLISGIFGGEQRVEAGGNIVVNGVGSASQNGILGEVLINPMFPVDGPGPNSFVRSLNLITSTNGMGISGIENIGVTFPLLAPPPGSSFSTGNVLIQAGGDITLSSAITAGSTTGTFNAAQTLTIQANTQFPMGALWPGNLILGMSPASTFPPGQGALTGNTGALATTVDLTTFQGNISIFSGDTDTLLSPVDFNLGAIANDFTITTTSGNILIDGFTNINVGQPLTTIGNPALVLPATAQLFARTLNSINLNSSLTVTGGGFGISLIADSSSTGVGLIDQTAGIVTASQISFSAAQGIANSVLANLALQTSGGTINALNTLTGQLNLENTVVGSNSTDIFATLANGTGAANTGRDVYFAQHGGTSLFVTGALADGDLSLLVYDGSANLTIDGLARAGQHVIGMAFNDMTLTVNGSVRAAENVTLIVDEATGPIFGGSTFSNLSTVGGVISDLAADNIAIYASSGPQAPAGLTAFNLITFGNLTTLPTWDETEPDGLITKYATSWQAGGPFHGPGFGTNYVPGTGVFGSAVVWYKIVPFVPPLDLGFQQQVFQAISLLDELKKWGEEISFSISESDSTLFRTFFFVEDVKRQHLAKDIYERSTRRKFVDDSI
jgi:filamentous hemagglutinin family protein